MKTRLFFFTLLTIIGLSANAQWIQTNGPFGGQSVQCMLVNGTNIFAGTATGGVFITNNNGNSWTAVNNGITNTYINALVINDTNIFAATDGGVFLSSNNGGFWTAVNNGIPNSTAVISLVICGNNIFAGLMGHGVYLSSNNGSTWTAINNGLQMQDTTHVIHLAVSDTNIFAGSLTGTYRTSNNGGLWTNVSSSVYYIYSFAISGNNIFAGSGSDSVFLSSNNGGLWTNVSNGLPHIEVLSFAIDGTNIFAGTGGEGVYLSSNNGGLWTSVNTISFANTAVLALAIYEDTLFAGTEASGVWKRALSQMTGIEEINNNTGNIAVYPNPATNNITIETIQSSVIEITNTQGQLLKTFTTTGNKTNIDVSALPGGVYLVKLITANGAEVRKFVKE